MSRVAESAFDSKPGSGCLS